ncbi:DUF6192 family protein [Streptomyces tsukubensis]|uniref:DUF6192 family protein n=1 Tax=Streptomyces tsukubensis TaxID=83656 RepID=UPI00344FE8DC
MGAHLAHGSADRPAHHQHEGEHYDGAEHDTISRGLARVRAAADWIEGAVTRGETDPDEQLAKLLKGQGE